VDGSERSLPPAAFPIPDERSQRPATFSETLADPSASSEAVFGGKWGAQSASFDMSSQCVFGVVVIILYARYGLGNAVVRDRVLCRGEALG
jgi:hypothetical protein